MKIKSENISADAVRMYLPQLLKPYAVCDDGELVEDFDNVPFDNVSYFLRLKISDIQTRTELLFNRYYYDQVADLDELSSEEVSERLSHPLTSHIIEPKKSVAFIPETKRVIALPPLQTAFFQRKYDRMLGLRPPGYTPPTLEEDISFDAIHLHLGQALLHHYKENGGPFLKTNDVVIDDLHFWCKVILDATGDNIRKILIASESCDRDSEFASDDASFIHPVTRTSHIIDIENGTASIAADLGHSLPLGNEQVEFISRTVDNLLENHRYDDDNDTLGRNKPHRQ